MTVLFLPGGPAFDVALIVAVAKAKSCLKGPRRQGELGGGHDIGIVQARELEMRVRLAKAKAAAGWVAPAPAPEVLSALAGASPPPRALS